MIDHSAEARAPARRNGIAGGLAAAVLLLSGTGAFADGDASAGRDKSETCKGCHGSEGYKNTYPTYNVPKLVGLSADYIVVALQSYRAGTREHPTMRSHAGSMTDQDIADIAAYIGSLSE